MSGENVNGAARPEPEFEAASAVAPHSLPDGSETTPSTANGRAAPLTLDELRAIPEAERTPRQKRRLTMLEKEAAAAARKAKRAAKAAAPAPAPAAQEAAEDGERDEAQRERETGGFWRLVLRVVSLLLYPFGWRLEPLTDREVAEDVALLAPLARRHRWLDVTIRYAAVPYLIVERIASKAKRRDPPPAQKGAK